MIKLDRSLYVTAFKFYEQIVIHSLLGTRVPLVTHLYVTRHLSMIK